MATLLILILVKSTRTHIFRLNVLFLVQIEIFLIVGLACALFPLKQLEAWERNAGSLAAVLADVGGLGLLGQAGH